MNTVELQYSGSKGTNNFSLLQADFCYCQYGKQTKVLSRDSKASIILGRVLLLAGPIKRGARYSAILVMRLNLQTQTVLNDCDQCVSMGRPSLSSFSFTRKNTQVLKCQTHFVILKSLSKTVKQRIHALSLVKREPKKNITAMRGIDMRMQQLYLQNRHHKITFGCYFVLGFCSLFFYFFFTCDAAT